MQKTMDELTVGEMFTVNDVKYVKISDVKVSCCRSVNCQEHDNSGSRHFFPGNTIVTTNG